MNWNECIFRDKSTLADISNIEKNTNVVIKENNMSLALGVFLLFMAFLYVYSDYDYR
jgi:hypothetical protein